jgi:hypothetical protein
MSIVEAGGSIYHQVNLRDMTERRREMRLLRESLEEREVSLHGLHHCVKSNLQFIQIQIRLQMEFEGGIQRQLSRRRGASAGIRLEVALDCEDLPLGPIRSFPSA